MILAVHPVMQGVAPELVLCVGASLVLILGLSRSRHIAESVFSVALFTVVVAIYAAYELSVTAPPADPRLIHDPMVWYVRLIGLSVGALILLTNRHVPEERERGEFFALILFSLAGLLLVSVANDLILLFLALELVSVPTYILVGLSRRDIRAQEATGKYFFLGAFAAAMTLYGFSFLYGAAGTTQLFGGPQQSIAGALRLDDPIVVLGLALSLGGLAFKIAAVPLHFYVADVYEGAAAPITGLLGFVPKFAGFVAIIRLLSTCGGDHGEAVFWLLWVLAAVTMIVGNTLALWQRNVKRMLAYSGVAHSGVMLVGLVGGAAAGTDGLPLRSGTAAVLFYMAVYGVMNLGAFAALSFFRKTGEDGEDSAETLEDLAGAARRHPWACLGLTVCVLGLMGLPPTGGFVAKWYVFTAAIGAAEGTARQTDMVVLVVIGVLNSAVAAAYYLKIIAACYFAKPAEGVRATTCPALRVSLAVCAALVLAAFARPTMLFRQAEEAAAQAVSAPVLLRTVESR